MKPSLPEALEILSLNPVQVMEGETSPITFNNINVIMDYAKYGIRDSSVIFNVTQTPHHGSINIGSSGIASHVIDVYTDFTLMNLAGEKVRIAKDSRAKCT